MDGKIIYNPYLPENEFVPDGEPRLFGDRVYIFGSHERGGGKMFCTEDYVCYSAHKDDLTQWDYEGVIYSKNQDPLNADGSHCMYAPDVQRGPDGRYYLYYGLDMTFTLSVAVSDSPAGPYDFYGHIQNPDGTLFKEEFPYDPSVLYEDSEHIYLYYGFSFLWPIKEHMRGSRGGMMVRLKSDMITVDCEPVKVLPAADSAHGTSFEGHANFEGPSIRKAGDTYYLVYCSERSNELCYATSRYPDKDFEFGGVIVSNADFSYQGNIEAKNYYGNNHGGLLMLEDRWYIFYHRHTHGTQFSRQACAERVFVDANGRIHQAEITSQGLFGRPLPAFQEYPIGIICNLTGPDGASESALFGPPLPENTPALVLEEGRLILRNLQPGASCAVKYFDFSGKTVSRIGMELRGNGGRLQIFADDHLLGTVCAAPAEQWVWETLDLEELSEKSAAIRFVCQGRPQTWLDLRGFRFQ